VGAGVAACELAYKRAHLQEVVELPTLLQAVGWLQASSNINISYSYLPVLADCGYGTFLVYNGISDWLAVAPR
jgi:hypothetical protein